MQASKLNSPCMIILSRSAKTRKEMQLCKLYNLVINIHIVLNYFHKKCLDISDLIFGRSYYINCADVVEVMCKGMSGTCTHRAEMIILLVSATICQACDDVVSILLLPDSSGESRK